MLQNYVILPGKYIFMLSIFQKKYYLVDLLEGLTDFHNHLLPNIDDGAKNWQDSIAMIKKFNEFGIYNFVCTPHVMGDYYPNTPETIDEALSILQKHIDFDVQITAAAEYMMDQHLVEIMASEDLLKVKDNKVLVEMSYFQQPINLIDILFKLQNKNYQPILAHPERYTFLHQKDLSAYKNLKSHGCVFQLNMLSLSEHYGIGIQKFAIKLLEEGLIDFIASDTHRIEHLKKLKTIKISKKHLKILEQVISRSKAIFN